VSKDFRPEEGRRVEMLYLKQRVKTHDYTGVVKYTDNEGFTVGEGTWHENMMGHGWSFRYLDEPAAPIRVRAGNNRARVIIRVGRRVVLDTNVDNYTYSVDMPVIRETTPGSMVTSFRHSGEIIISIRGMDGPPISPPRKTRKRPPRGRGRGPSPSPRPRSRRSSRRTAG
jgi:hypothetical protein